MNFRSSFSMRPALLLTLASSLTFPGFSMQAQANNAPAAQTTDAQSTLSVTTSSKKKPRVAKEDRVQQSKATKQEVKKEDKYNPLIAKDQALPDKQLYDKALQQEKSGHYDIARLDLQTLMNTYPDSQYLMRAKLAVADSWYREGGSAELAQAEQEYKDFITFFPNSPEAAEAQMRVGDIYFKQMDVPDRDYSKAINAETEYRTMLKQYPDAPPTILKQAQQKLREVQEVLATRESGIASYYASRNNWPAEIARYQTVADSYPLYSHMDDVMIAIGDAYEEEAKAVRERPVCAPGVLVPCLPEGAKSKLEQAFDGKAAEEYRNVVLNHSAAPHVEDAKDRLQAMNLPIPTPTAKERAASDALEGSRAQYSMRSRMELLVMHKPDTVTAAQVGDPPLEDPPATTAPTILNDLQAEYAAALNPAAAAKAASEKAAVAHSPANSEASDAPAAPAGAAPLALSDVPSAGAAADTGSTSEVAPATGDTGGASTGIGSSIVSTGGTTVPASDLPAATGAPDPNYGLPTVAPKNSTPLPAAEAPAAAPDQVNEAAGKQTLPAATNKPDKSGKAPGYDKGEESSSKHTPKKGLDKLNPF